MRRFVLILIVSLSPWFLQGQGKTTVVAQERLRTTIEYTPLKYVGDTVRVKGSSVLYFRGAERSYEPGIIALPRESFLLAVPPGTSPRVEVLGSTSRVTKGVRLAPVPALIAVDDSSNRVAERFDDDLAGVPETGGTEALVKEVFTWRGMRIARIEVRPLSYNASTQELMHRTAIRLRISFVETPSKQTGPLSALPRDPLNKLLLSNADQIPLWYGNRVESKVGNLSVLEDSTRAWFETGREYLRIPIGRDGIYSLSFEDVTSVLSNSGPFDSDRLVLFYKGVKLPVIVTGSNDGTFGPGDSVLFYGSRLLDSLNQPDQYSDTSVYWLTYDHDPGSTYVNEQQIGTPVDTVNSFRHSVRVERDSIYFFGNGGLVINNSTGEAPGEGWYWRRLFVNQSTSFPFMVPNPDTSGLPLELRGRFHSPVQNQSTPSHQIEIRINGSLVGSIVFNNDRDTVFTFPFSSNVIQAGINNITLISQPTAALLNEVYIDWLDVRVKEKLAATSDTLLFTPEMPEGAVALFQVTGFIGTEQLAVRLGDQGAIEKVFTGSTTGTGPFAFSFSDTIVTGRKYYVSARNRFLQPVGLQRKLFQDIRADAAGADYVIITVPEFNGAASQLSIYRSQNGIGRTKTVFVNDIVDEFNFGHKSPFPIRSFLRAADSLWPGPGPSYILLLGDANWDSKNNMGSTRQNLIPSYGNPVSDAWYAASASDGLFPERFIGRIPAQTSQEAMKVVNEIIMYESQSLSSWNKTFLFMSAGYTATEAQRFQQFSDDMIGLYVSSDPISGTGARIYRPPSNVIQFEVTDSIKAIIDHGALWVNYYGHSGPELWGNGIYQPDQLVNTNGKRHLISDISCSTVRFAEPSIEAFGERMLFGEEGGAIGYIGSSGFGFESPLRVLAQEMYRSIAQDTVRELGRILLTAKVKLWQTGTSLLNRQALDQFTLLGDPAARLALATQPDYAIDGEEVFVVPNQPTEFDSLKIHIPVFNYGLKSRDTVSIALEHSFQSIGTPLTSVILPPVGRGDTVVVQSELFQQPGLHSVQIQVDPEIRLAEVSRTNNAANATFFVVSQQLLPLWPLPFSTHHPDSLLLIVQNPNQPQAATWNAVFQIDTTAEFSSPTVINTPGITQGVYSSEWRVPENLLLDSALYYWRARLSSGLDSTNWVGGSFWTRIGLRTSWHQETHALLTGNVLNNILGENGARLGYANTEIALHSAGFDAGDSASIYLDGNNISLGIAERGYNVAVLNPYNAAVEQFGAFRTYSDVPDTSGVELLIQFLNAIPQGRIVLIAIADEGAVNKTERLNQAIESVGSGLIRSLGFRSSWAIIGRKGAPAGTMPEVLKPSNGGPASLVDTVLFAAVEGTVTTPFIGPASSWGWMITDSDTSMTGTHLSFNLIRRHSTGNIDTVGGVPGGMTLLASYLEPSVQQLKLQANLTSDSPGLSPILRSWTISFEPPAELGINYQTIDISSDTVLEGTNVTMGITVHNTSPTNSTGVKIRIVTSAVFVDSTLMTVPAFGSSSHSFSLSTTGRTGQPVFSISVDPENQIAESFKANNQFSISVTVLGDTIAPLFDITFDGNRVFDNDYVRPEPEIRILIRDNSPLPITDPNSVVLKLNNRRITLGSSPDSLFETLTGAEKAGVTFRPSLAKGEHILSVQVLDASGNPADTMEYEIRFKVETDLRLLNVFNFPNPFSSETAFTFHLTGLGIPEEVSLRVYTTAGRLIYERRLMPGEVNVGFNRIPWDGRDQNGDAIANGVYFYKVSALQNGKRVEVVEKMARVR